MCLGDNDYILHKGIEFIGLISCLSQGFGIGWSSGVPQPSPLCVLVSCLSEGPILLIEYALCA